MFKIQKRIIYAIEAVIDIALNSGINPVQNISIAKRQGIPKRYLEQTLQTLVKNISWLLLLLILNMSNKTKYRISRALHWIRFTCLSLAKLGVKQLGLVWLKEPRYVKIKLCQEMFQNWRNILTFA